MLSGARLPRVLLVALIAGATASAEKGTGVEQATKVLDMAIQDPPRSAAALRDTRSALELLGKHKPNGVAERVLKIASDPRQDKDVRGKAFDLLGVLPDSPVEKARALLLGVAKDRGQDLSLRHKAIFAFGNRRLVDPGALAALEEVLARADDDGPVQRSCLYTLARTVPLPRIRRLLLTRAVYEHPYFGIRIDVCTGLAALNVRSRLALEILCDYMVEADPTDTTIMVPQEAWLSFWVLTGRALGVDQPALFRQPPAPIPEGERRALLFRPSQLRNGVTYPMVQAFQRLAWKNFAAVKAARRKPISPTRAAAALKQVAALSRADIPAILKRWQAK